METRPKTSGMDLFDQNQFRFWSGDVCRDLGKEDKQISTNLEIILT